MCLSINTNTSTVPHYKPAVHNLKTLMNKVTCIANIRFILLSIAVLSGAVTIYATFAALPIVACGSAVIVGSSLIARYAIRKIRPYLILSIDGGGVRGIIPAKILSMLEKRIGAKIIEKFDLIAGTSVGAILTASLVKPDAVDETKPQYSAKQIRHLFKAQAEEIFGTPSSWIERIKEPKYDGVGLNKALRKILEETPLNKAVTDLLITSFDMETYQDYYFKKTSSYSLFDAARASASAPMYFPSYQLEKKNLVDGGLVANDPSLLAFFETQKLSNLKDRDIFILSIGTGSFPETPVPAPDSEKWGILQWLYGGRILNTMFDANAQKTHETLATLAKTRRIYYQRLQVKLENANQYEMDNIFPDNLSSLQTLAKKSCLSWIEQGLHEELIDPLRNC